MSLRRTGCAVCLCAVLLFGGCVRQTAPHPENITPATEDAAFVRAFWIPFMETEGLLSSGDPSTCREAIAACLEDCAAKGANTVYWHVRANSDAYYDSALFDPNPTTAALLSKGFDPLACAVEEAHKRGLALHAWVNPYRIGTDASRAKAPAVFSHGDRWYYAPHDNAVQTLIVAGVREIVSGYAVDGVQFDDYFYPSGAVDAASPAAFEQEAYTAYTQNGGKLSVGDWRRAQVDRLMASCYAVCHQREACMFGISPAYNTQQCRETLYADVALWARVAGYVDYLCPQLYVGFAHEYVPFEAVLETWRTLPRDASVTLYVGLALYKTGLYEDTYAGDGRAEWVQRHDILSRQILLVRESDFGGVALYSHLSLTDTHGRDAAIASKEADAALAVWR